MKRLCQDLNLLLSRVPDHALRFTVTSLRAGRVRAGSYSACLMTMLSVQRDGQFVVTHRSRLVPWLKELDPEMATELEAAARRLVRAFDEANPEDPLVLEAPKSEYEKRYPLQYRLTKATALAFVEQHLSSRRKQTNRQAELAGVACGS